MELTRDEAKALARRCLRLAGRAIRDGDPRGYIEHAERGVGFAGIVKELGTFDNGWQTKIVRLELADRPNQHAEAAIAAGWTQEEAWPRKWTHPDRGRNYYSSAAAVCEFEGLEVEKAHERPDRST